MKEIIIFCQAPADVQYALSIYNKQKNFSVISIFCINVEGIFKFLSSLNLNLRELIFIPYSKAISKREPLHILNERSRLNKLFRKHFINTTKHELYFFSHWYDWVLYGLLAKLYKNNKIYLIDHYGYTSDKFSKANNTIKLVINLLIYKFITGIYFNTYSIDEGFPILSLPIFKYNIEKLNIPQDINKTWIKYKFNIPIKQKSILLFENGIAEHVLISNYEQTITSIILVFHQMNIKVFIKPHPRVGFTKNLSNYAEIIPSYIPGEFLPIEEFIGVFGISSAVLGKLAKTYTKIYSIIDLFSYIIESDKDYYKNYLIEQSNNNVIFLSQIEEIVKSDHSKKVALIRTN